MTQRQLKKKIQKKFGTMSKFATLSGYDRTKLQILINQAKPSKKEMEAVSALVDETKVKGAPGDITSELKQAIKDALMEYGGVVKFIGDHDQFNRISVYQILDGRRTRISKKVKELCKILNVKIEEDEKD